MEHIRLGSTGMKVSRICLGCMSYGDPTKGFQWALDEEHSRPYIRRALELGINFFDAADVYSNG
jgi:aryl-alcohol dehydrogenase-like predicted oxidoreductase